MEITEHERVLLVNSLIQTITASSTSTTGTRTAPRSERCSPA
jgi:hypothetical protein